MSEREPVHNDRVYIYIYEQSFVAQLLSQNNFVTMTIKKSTNIAINIIIPQKLWYVSRVEIRLNPKKKKKLPGTLKLVIYSGEFQEQIALGEAKGELKCIDFGDQFICLHNRIIFNGHADKYIDINISFLKYEISSQKKIDCDVC